MMEKKDSLIRRLQGAKRRMKGLVLIMTTLIFSCTTVSSLPQTGLEFESQGPDTTNHAYSRVYDYPYFRVFTVAAIVLQSQDFSVDKENREDRVILASGPIQAFGNGPILGLYFREIGIDRTLVGTVETRKLAAQLGTKWSSPALLDGIEKQLSSFNPVKK